MFDQKYEIVEVTNFLGRKQIFHLKKSEIHFSCISTELYIYIEINHHSTEKPLSNDNKFVQFSPFHL